MNRKIGIVILHGLGRQKKDYAASFVDLLQEKYRKASGRKSSDLVIEPVYWADIFEAREQRLYERLVVGNRLRYRDLRRFVIHYLADAVAYQPVDSKEQNYEAVHRTISEALNRLSHRAGATAPLYVIAHSLGAVIASNYFYDLQRTARRDAVMIDRESPLERGETLTRFLSLGTTLPLWSLRYRDFNQPIVVPSPLLHRHHPGIQGGWINYYDKDDILAYPLRDIDPMYARAVKKDVQISVGNWLTSWNPFCHSGYFKSKTIAEAIAKMMVDTWKSMS